MTTIERWDIWELDLAAAGLVGRDVSPAAIEATFTGPGDRPARFVADAFPGGAGAVVRFSPDAEGPWSYAIRMGGDVISTGRFDCAPPLTSRQTAAGNHGPVRVVNTTRFGYADGTAYHPLPTSALGWHEQSDDNRAATLASLEEAPFTQVRMSVLPLELEGWPEPKHLDRVEAGVADLLELGLGAELVLFGAQTPLQEGWETYVRETVARLAAYRNVSWCVVTDVHESGVHDAVWDDVLRVIAEADYGRHLLTLHGDAKSNFGRALLTHASVRHDQTRIASVIAADFTKPAVLDSMGMEGNAPDRDAALTGQELVERLWEATCRGGYAAHGEWFVQPDGDPSDDRPWSTHGGRLAGESAARIAFLQEILAAAPADLRYSAVDHDASTLEAPGEFWLQYYGRHRFRTRRFALPEGEFKVEIIDTWNMTIREVRPTLSGDIVLDLPGGLYYAVRITRA